jgi:hypothetical protein
VDTILGGPDAVLVDEVVAVAADVIPLVYHQDAESTYTLTCRYLRYG